MDELRHYGVKGMRWGVRKSASPIYLRTHNKFGEDYSDRYKKKMSKSAVRIEKREKQAYDFASKRHAAVADNAGKKGDTVKQKQYMDSAKAFSKKSDILRKRISDIEAGKLKAGKDYITNYEYTANLVINLLSPYDIIEWRTYLEYR